MKKLWKGRELRDKEQQKQKKTSIAKKEFVRGHSFMTFAKNYKFWMSIPLLPSIHNDPILILADPTRGHP